MPGTRLPDGLLGGSLFQELAGRAQIWTDRTELADERPLVVRCAGRRDISILLYWTIPRAGEGTHSSVPTFLTYPVARLFFIVLRASPRSTAGRLGMLSLTVGMSCQTVHHVVEFSSQHFFGAPLCAEYRQCHSSQ